MRFKITCIAYISSHSTLLKKFVIIGIVHYSSRPISLVRLAIKLQYIDSEAPKCTKLMTVRQCELFEKEWLAWTVYYSNWMARNVNYRCDFEAYKNLSHKQSVLFYGHPRKSPVSPVFFDLNRMIKKRWRMNNFEIILQHQSLLLVHSISFWLSDFEFQSWISNWDYYLK